MYTYEELYTLFSKHLGKQSFSKNPKELYEPIVYSLSQCGKRLRPIFTLMACDLFEGNIQKALPQALAIELLHNFTLMHDDLMDQSPIRHGKETIFKKWNPNMAILAGDALYVLAYNYTLQADIEILPDILSTFNKTALKACEGQQLDLNFEKRKIVSLEDYIEMIRLKTALLFGASLKIGAIIARASTKDTQLIYEFGINIGLGFQLKDDLLDLYGNEKVFGKKTGQDILENKKTYLFTKATATADPKTKELLLDHFHGKELPEKEKIRYFRKIFDALDIEKLTNDAIYNYLDKGLEKLDRIDCPEERKQSLKNLAHTMISRKK
ncbi:MAG: isoprenyl synthetase [bacterium]|nr:MAG: isoprenyl synthetase [bacterium]